MAQNNKKKIFIDRSREPIRFYSNSGNIPAKNEDIEITEEGSGYYWENKDKYNINLNNVPDSPITIDKIKKHAVDMEKVKAAKVDELKENLSATDYKILKCNEYTMAGLPLPYDITEVHKQRQGIRDAINEIEGGLISPKAWGFYE